VVPIPDASPSAALRNLGGGTPRLPTPVQGPDTDPSALQLPQLLTDNQGVDFAPYLRLILQTVKRNWQSVMPEAVRLGRRGKVSIVFSIGRDGQVIKLVINDSSGIDSFDKAAVAGISMSNPFPPLPSAFKADHIAVQFNFARVLCAFPSARVHYCVPDSAKESCSTLRSHHRLHFIFHS